jgi:PAS domain S-box-containing protein
MKSEIVNVDEIEDIIIAYANGELHRRLDISDKRDDRDTIIAGINMLGEELERTTISRDYFISIYNSVSDVLLITDLECNILDANLTAEKTFHQTPNSLIGKNFWSIICKRFLHMEELIHNAFKDGQMSMPFEAALCVKPSVEMPVSCSLSKIIDRSGVHKGFLFVAKDITDRKLKEINDVKIAIASQEKERRRLANDLHDSLGQEINAIRMYMNALAEMDKSSELYKEAFETCKTIVDHSLETIRNISFDLMPRSLEHGSLVQAIEELVKKLQLVYKIEFTYSTLDLETDLETRTNLYRIIQEFINNSLKHAGKSTIKIHLVKHKTHITLNISDNGKGFDTETLKYGKGIYSIKSRLKALNAEYTFTSKINEGTFLELAINDKSWKN